MWPPTPTTTRTILLNTLISEFLILDNPFGKDETVQGLCLLDTHLVIYGQFTWVTFNMSGKEVSRKKILRETPILRMQMELLDEFSLICWSGEEANLEMALETYKEGKVGQILGVPQRGGLEPGSDHGLGV